MKISFGITSNFDGRAVYMLPSLFEVVSSLAELFENKLANKILDLAEDLK